MSSIFITNDYYSVLEIWTSVEEEKRSLILTLHLVRKIRVLINLDRSMSKVYLIRKKEKYKCIEIKKHENNNVHRVYSQTK